MLDLSAAELLRKCCDLIDGYQSEVICPEEYIKRNIEESLLHPDEKFFLIEVFSGTLQYDKVLNELLNVLYAGDGRNLLLSDRSVFRTLSYLLLFRFTELTKNKRLQSFLEAIDYRKIILLLNLLINEKDKRRLKKKWQTIYDVKYVDELLISALTENKSDLIAIRDRLKGKSANVGKFVKKPPTEPNSFKLKQKKPIEMPEPEVLETIAPPNIIPATTYSQPEYLDPLLLRDREHERQARVAALLKDADASAFGCAVTDKSDKTIQRMQQIRLDESRKLDFNKKHTAPLRSAASKAPAIKMTTAALLREEKLYSRKEEQSLQQLEKLLQGARDDSDFRRWRDKIKQEDMDEQLTRQFENILSGQLSREEAVLAKQREIEHKRIEAEVLKKESEKLLRRKEILDEKEAALVRKRNQEIAEADRNGTIAKQALEMEKRFIVAEIQKDKDQMWRQKEHEEKIELERKKALIREIRALEAERIEDKNYKLPVDLTSTAGHALLGEMCIAELRERLALLKEKEREREEQKRREISDGKIRQGQRLDEAKRKIQAHRSHIQQTAKEDRRNNIITPTMKQERLKELESKLSERRNERIKFQRESKLRGPTNKSIHI